MDNNLFSIFVFQFPGTEMNGIAWVFSTDIDGMTHMKMVFVRNENRIFFCFSYIN